MPSALVKRKPRLFSSRSPNLIRSSYSNVHGIAKEVCPDPERKTVDKRQSEDTRKSHFAEGRPPPCFPHHPKLASSWQWATHATIRRHGGSYSLPGQALHSRAGNQACRLAVTLWRRDLSQADCLWARTVSGHCIHTGPIPKHRVLAISHYIYRAGRARVPKTGKCQHCPTVTPIEYPKGREIALHLSWLSYSVSPWMGIYGLFVLHSLPPFAISLPERRHPKTRNRDRQRHRDTRARTEWDRVNKFDGLVSGSMMSMGYGPWEQSRSDLESQQLATGGFGRFRNLSKYYS